MTEYEAINEFKERLAIPDYKKSIPKYYEAMEMAVKALEKQIAKRDKNDCGRCVACGTYNNFIINKLANPKAHLIIHCWNCGQAIDWGNEDEE